MIEELTMSRYRVKLTSGKRFNVTKVDGVIPPEDVIVLADENVAEISEIRDKQDR